MCMLPSCEGLLALHMKPSHEAFFALLKNLVYEGGENRGSKEGLHMKPFLLHKKAPASQEAW